jgi:hypothetical protein
MKRVFAPIAAVIATLTAIAATGGAVALAPSGLAEDPPIGPPPLRDGRFHLNLLITSPDYSGCDDPAYDWIDAGTCADLASAPHAGEAFVWVVASRDGGFPGDGIGAVQFGIEYTTAVTEWVLCTGGLDIPQDGWPESGRGYAAAWFEGCYRSPGENAKVGYFRVEDGASGSMAIIPDPRVNYVLWALCDAEYLRVCDSNVGSADLSLGTVPACVDPGPAAAHDCDATDDSCAVTVTWAHDGLNVTGFRITRDGEPLSDVDAGDREYIDDAQSPGESYEYGVIAFNACGAATPSIDVGGAPLPVAAANCAATENRCDLVRVTWEDRSDNETGFRVERNGWPRAVVGAGVTQFDDSTAIAGTTYLYAVVVLGECGDGERSNVDPGRKERPPARATHCTATDSLCGLVRITWEDHSFNETGFKILRDGEVVGIAGASAEQYDDSTDAQGPFLYTVVATNDCADAEPSDADEGGTGSDPPPAATACSATDNLCDYVRVTWQDNSEDEIGFRVLRDGAEIATAPANTTQYEDTTAVIDAVYDYAMVATNRCGDADPSNVDEGKRVIAVTPPVPLLVGPADSAGCVPCPVTFTWRRVPDAILYRIEIGTDCGVADIADVTTSDTTCAVSIPAGWTSFWRVRAKNVCDRWSDPSACWSLETRPVLAAPAGFDAAPSDTSVYYWVFSWEAVDQAERYLLRIGWCFWEEESTVFAVMGTDTTLDMTLWGAGEAYGPSFQAWVTGFACGEQGENSECFDYVQWPPVLLESFNAHPTDWGILVEWRTSQERDVRGFNLLRAQGTEEFVRVNPNPIPPGSTVYRYEDRGATGGAEYTYRLFEIELDGAEALLGEVTVTGRLIPETFALLQNRPNPFNPTTWIVFQLPVRERVVIDIFDAAGRRARRLVDSRYDAGIHRVLWDARDDARRSVTSGTYFARFEAGGHRDVRRLVLLK